jgi:hypothetical protein
MVKWYQDAVPVISPHLDPLFIVQLDCDWADSEAITICPLLLLEVQGHRTVV